MDPLHTSDLQVGDSIQQNTNQQLTIYFEDCVPFHGEEITLEYKEVDTSERVQEDKLDTAEGTKSDSIEEPSQQFTKDPILTNVGRPKLECVENLLLEYTGPISPYIDEPTFIDEPSLDCFNMPLSEEYLDKLIPESTEETRLKYVEDDIPHLPYIEEDSNSFDYIGYKLQNIEGKISENIDQPLHDQKKLFGQPEKHYMPIENLTPESLPESLRELVFKSSEVENPLKHNILETRKAVESLKELMPEPANETVSESSVHVVLTFEETALTPKDKQSTSPAPKQESIQQHIAVIGQEYNLVPIEQPTSTIESLKHQEETNYAVTDNTLQNIEVEEFENIDEPIFKHVDVAEFFIQPVKFNISEPMENIQVESVSESAQELTLATTEIEEPQGYNLQETTEAEEWLTKLMQEPTCKVIVEPVEHLVLAMEEPASPQYQYILTDLDQSSTPAPKRKSISPPPLVPIRKPKLKPVVKSEKGREPSEEPVQIPKIVIRRIKANEKTRGLDEQVPEQREEGTTEEETDEGKETVRDIWRRISATGREEKIDKKEHVKVNIKKKAKSKPKKLSKLETKNQIKGIK